MISKFRNWKVFFNSFFVSFQWKRPDKQLNQIFKPKSQSQLPGPIPSLPFFGTNWQYWPLVGRYNLLELHEAYKDQHQLFGSIFKEEFQRGKILVHLSDPQDFERVFRNQGKCPMRPANEFVRYYRTKNKHRYPNVGMAHLTGEEWFRLRSLLAPVMMKPEVVQDYIVGQMNVCSGLVELLKETPSVDDFRDISYRFALESVIFICLGKRICCFGKLNQDHNYGQVLVDATKKLFEAYQKLYYGLPLWKWIPTPAFKKLEQAETTIYDIVGEQMDELLVLDNHQHKSLMKTLLKIEGLSIDEVKITIMDFISGGIFTVSNALNFIIYHLAVNQNAQQKLFQELQDNFNSKSLDDINNIQLPYLRGCIKESFRLTSTIPGIMRILPVDLNLSGYYIKSGTLLFTNFYVAGHSSNIFENPNKFIPERWIGSAKKEINSFAVLPFGHGNRMCVGRRLAQMQLEMAVAYLVKNFHISMPGEDATIDLEFNFLIVPKSAIKLNLIKR